MKQMLSPQQIAKILQINVFTIYTWLERGFLPAIKCGRCWRLDLDEVLSWLKTDGIKKAREKKEAK